jgi:hypothetical protein
MSKARKQSRKTVRTKGGVKPLLDSENTEQPEG